MEYEISERLRCFRKQKGYTQEQLAEKLEISRSKVSSWENSTKRSMTIKDALKLAKTYNTSLDYLFGIDKIGMEQFIEISNKFLKNKDVTVIDKTKIIESIRECLKKEHAEDYYDYLATTQNATK